MRSLAVVCEFNPFHNGHSYFVEQARQLSRADTVVCIMSGSFVQRGESAVLPRFVRAKHAVLNGADIVVELPACASVLNAEMFAMAGVKTAQYLGIDCLAFGSECGDITKLQNLADFISCDSLDYKTALKCELDKGLSYPSAQARALSATCPELDSSIIDKPNDLLAVMYLVAIKRLNANITPVVVSRSDHGYHALTPKHSFLSAGGIREQLKNGQYSKIKQYVPESVFNDLSEITVTDKLGDLILYKLKSLTANSLSNLFDICEGLDNRIKKAARTATDYASFLSAVKTKRYTMARLKRIGLYALLDISVEFVRQFVKALPYCRVLAIKQNKTEILSAWKDKNNVITRYSDLDKADSTSVPLYEFENKAASILQIITGIPDGERNMLVL